MELTKERLDKRICDIQKYAKNTQTYREFIVESEKEFGMEHRDLDGMTDENLNEYLEFLDYLWGK